MVRVNSYRGYTVVKICRRVEFPGSAGSAGAGNAGWLASCPQPVVQTSSKMKVAASQGPTRLLCTTKRFYPLAVTVSLLVRNFPSKYNTGSKQKLSRRRNTVWFQLAGVHCRVSIGRATINLVKFT